MAVASSSMTVFLLYLCHFAFVSLATAILDLQQLISTPSLYIFGASMVDAGENSVPMPRSSHADFHPYGVDYFSKPAGRWSNGRTLMDFITQGLGIGIVPPYLKTFDADFTYGVNFASSGSTALNTTVSSVTDSAGLFCLMRQIEQFRDYQDNINSLTRPHEKLQLEEHFKKSIYFMETAHNDYLLVAFMTSAFDIVSTVESVISGMKQALQALYDSGARTFIVMNVTPLGCNPATNSNPYGSGERDEYGCKTDYLHLVSVHNEYLLNLLAEMQEQYPTAEWIYFDAFSIMLDGYRNPSKYGVKYPLKACCGAGGTYNYIEEAQCGAPGVYMNDTYVVATRCEDPSMHIIWDTLHPVESFCQYLAWGVLNDTHLIPSFQIMDRFQSIDITSKQAIPINTFQASNFN